VLEVVFRCAVGFLHDFAVQRAVEIGERAARCAGSRSAMGQTKASGQNKKSQQRYQDSAENLCYEYGYE